MEPVPGDISRPTRGRARAWATSGWQVHVDQHMAHPRAGGRPPGCPALYVWSELAGQGDVAASLSIELNYYKKPCAPRSPCPSCRLPSSPPNPAVVVRPHRRPCRLWSLPPSIRWWQSWWQSRPADAAAYAQRLRAYLDAHPAFYGSAVALLDRAGTPTTSPYVYRTADGYDTLDLAMPPYNIEAQDWFTMPLAMNASIWTAPYFDAGGGEIWMITRSVPARDDEGVFAIVTTDLPVDAPQE